MTTDSALRELVADLVKHIEGNTCTHEETHRGGAIWEICDSCGEQWADDRGGRPDFKWPDCVEKARDFLTAAASQQPATAGMVLVPRDAIPAMVEAALAVDWTGPDGDTEAVVHNVWHAMLAAAPAAQAEVSPALPVVGLLKEHNACIYEFDFGDEGTARYVRLEDFNRIVAAAQVAVLATGWFHPMPKGDPLNGGDSGDYEFHDLTNCPTQPCPKCIPAYIVRRDAAAPAVVVDEAMVETLLLRVMQQTGPYPRDLIDRTRTALAAILKR